MQNSKGTYVSKSEHLLQTANAYEGVQCSVSSVIVVAPNENIWQELTCIWLQLGDNKVIRFYVMTKLIP